MRPLQLSIVFALAGLSGALPVEERSPLLSHDPIVSLMQASSGAGSDDVENMPDCRQKYIECVSAGTNSRTCGRERKECMKIPSTSTPTSAPTFAPCTTTPVTPPTNTQNLVPQAATVVYTDTTANAPPSICGATCFAPDCYDRVPDECCSLADTQLTDLSQTFTNGKTCNGPLILPGSDISVYIGGGCSESGELYYGEQCGGNTFGPFSQLTNSDGSINQTINLGSCPQPAAICSCNAVVRTSSAGCFRIGTPPGNTAYFLRVDSAVCAAPPIPTDVPTSAPTSMDTRAPTFMANKNACDFTGMPFATAVGNTPFGFVDSATTTVIDGSTPPAYFASLSNAGYPQFSNATLSQRKVVNMVHYVPGIEDQVNEEDRVNVFGMPGCVPPGAPIVGQCGRYHVIEYHSDCKIPMRMVLDAGGPDLNFTYTNENGTLKGCENKVKTERFHCFMKTSADQQMPLPMECDECPQPSPQPVPPVPTETHSPSPAPLYDFSATYVIYPTTPDPVKCPAFPKHAEVPAECCDQSGAQLLPVSFLQPEKGNCNYLQGFLPGAIAVVYGSCAVDGTATYGEVCRPRDVALPYPVTTANKNFPSGSKELLAGAIPINVVRTKVPSPDSCGCAFTEGGEMNFSKTECAGDGLVSTRLSGNPIHFPEGIVSTDPSVAAWTGGCERYIQFENTGNERCFAVTDVQEYGPQFKTALSGVIFLKTYGCSPQK